MYAADRAFRVPFAGEAGYIDEVLSIAVAEHVGLVVPTIDDELALRPRRACLCRTRHPRRCRRPRSRALRRQVLNACRVLADSGVPSAASARGCRPTRRSRSSSSRVAGAVASARTPCGTAASWTSSSTTWRTPSCRPTSTGPSSPSTCCATSAAGRSRWSAPPGRHPRGLIDRGCTVRDPRLIEMALSCAGALSLVGAVNIQCRVVDGQPMVFEINPRFSGGIPLTIAAGADFPRMLVDLARGRKVRPSIGRFRDRLWMTSFETSVFVDEAHVALPAHQPRPVQEAVA
ncbi:MAG: ATP-grasp domain-containing protein [Vicinamibacterales bacterium]